MSCLSMPEAKLKTSAGGWATRKFDYEIAGRQACTEDATQQVRKYLYESVYGRLQALEVYGSAATHQRKIEVSYPSSGFQGLPANAVFEIAPSSRAAA